MQAGLEKQVDGLPVHPSHGASQHKVVYRCDHREQTLGPDSTVSAICGFLRVPGGQAQSPFVAIVVPANLSIARVALEGLVD